MWPLASWADLKGLQRISLEYNPATNVTPSVTESRLKFLLVPDSWVKVYKEANLPAAWNQEIKMSSHPGSVKLLIHPQDSRTESEFQKILSSNGYKRQVYHERRFLGITESRSLFPVNGRPQKAAISPRLSMTDGFGQWEGREGAGFLDYDRAETLTKMIGPAEAEFAFKASQWVQESLGGTSGQHFEFLPDRMSVAIRVGKSSLSQRAMTFRDVSALNRPGLMHFPGFTAVHEIGGSILALTNGFLNPETYLQKVMAKTIGRGWAEFIFSTQFVHSSPHLQNVLFEINDLLQSKDRMYIRDGSDLVPLIESRHYEEVMSRYSEGREALKSGLQGTADQFVFRYTFNHGNSFSFLNSTEKVEHAVNHHFLKMLAKMSGVSYRELWSIATFYSNLDYAELVLAKDNSIWSRVLEGLKSYNPATSSGEVLKESTVDRQVRDLVEKIMTGRLRDWSPSPLLLKALLVAKFRGNQLSIQRSNSLARTWNSYFEKKGHRFKGAAWIASALVVLDTVNPALFMKIWPHLKYPVYRKILLRNFLEKRSVSENVELIQKLTERRSRDPEVKDYISSVSVRMKVGGDRKSGSSSWRENWQTQRIIEVVYFYFRQVTPSEPLTEFIGLNVEKGRLPDRVMEDLASRSQRRELPWYEKDLFQLDTRYRNFIEQVNAVGGCRRSVGR